MAVTRIYYFEIVAAEDGSAIYGKRFEQAVESGQYHEMIAQAALSNSLPGEIHAADTRRPLHEVAAHNGNLEIYASTHEACAYAFRLNAAREGEQRLEFAADPFIRLPLNSSPNEDFLTDLRMYEGTEAKRWASFVCDHRAVRTSTLADRIRKLMDAHNSAEPTYLRLPFLFNVIDPLELKAAPWVVPDGPHQHRHAAKRHLIHGGVHPNSLAGLVVQI